MDLVSLKDKVLNDVVDVIIQALEKGAMTEQEVAPIADFVLGKIDAINNEVEMGNFLSELSQKWPMFAVVATVQQGEATEKAEGEVAEGVLHLAQSGKIEEAISLAKSATQAN